MKNILFAILMIASLTVFSASTNNLSAKETAQVSVKLPEPPPGYVAEYINGKWYWVLYNDRGYIVDVIEMDD